MDWCKKKKTCHATSWSNTITKTCKGPSKLVKKNWDNLIRKVYFFVVAILGDIQKDYFVMLKVACSENILQGKGCLTSSIKSPGFSPALSARLPGSTLSRYCRAGNSGVGWKSSSPFLVLCAIKNKIIDYRTADIKFIVYYCFSLVDLITWSV